MPTGKISLTLHEKEQFESQTVMLSGHGYVRCVFKKCTVVVTNSPLMIKHCQFYNCNWRFEYDVLWGNRGHTKLLKEIIAMIEGGTVKDVSSVVH
ncbi:MAG: hypothetical protein HQM16_02210 [Deltaproteobacteria bacterium]|nr:hypothetical protein [Deltaproteobacteria bacterium]